MSRIRNTDGDNHFTAGGPGLVPASSDREVPGQASPLPGLDYWPRGARQSTLLPQEEGLGSQVIIKYLVLWRIVFSCLNIVIPSLCLASYGASEAVYPCNVVEKIHEYFRSKMRQYL
jgi:hypothetical protein